MSKVWSPAALWSTRRILEAPSTDEPVSRPVASPFPTWRRRVLCDATRRGAIPEEPRYDKAGRLVVQMMAIKLVFFVLFIIANICIGLTVHR